MTAFWESIRDGSWLTANRIRAVAWMVFAVSLAATAFVLATSNGLIDYQGRPLGTDFSNVYSAGTYAREGHAEAPYDHALQLQREEKLFGPDTPLYSWHYPPLLLLAAEPLAMLPYTAALGVWEIGTILLYLLTIGAIVRFYRPAKPPAAAPKSIDPGWLLLALAYPAVLINLLHGNNAFLTTALLAGGLTLLDRRPLAAGILFGLLAYKPQFGVLLPLVLIATGRWRTATAATVTLALLCAITLFLYPEAWRAFINTTDQTRRLILDEGGPGLHKIQSIFAWVRMWGGPIPLAYAFQGMLTLTIAVAVVWLWRSDAAYPLKAAVLTIGAILATPYSLDYDLTVAAPAIAWLAFYGIEKGFAPFEASALAALWLVPLIVRGVAQMTTIPLGVITLLIVLIIVLRRAAMDVAQRRALAFALHQ